eukprot:2803987-Pleurochrysis_carterae.AAC.2
MSDIRGKPSNASQMLKPQKSFLLQLVWPSWDDEKFLVAIAQANSLLLAPPSWTHTATGRVCFGNASHPETALAVLSCPKWNALYAKTRF